MDLADPAKRLQVPGEVRPAHRDANAVLALGQRPDQVAAEDAVFTVDTGMCNVWAARYITRGAEQMAEAGVIDVDPTLFGWTMWAAIHGIVMLHQSGMLAHGPDYKALSAFLGTLSMKGAGTAKGARKGKRR